MERTQEKCLLFVGSRSRRSVFSIKMVESPSQVFFLQKGGGEKWMGDCFLFYTKGKFDRLCQMLGWRYKYKGVGYNFPVTIEW